MIRLLDYYRFIARKLFTWIFSLLENSLMINGRKGYVKQPNRKSGIRSMPLHMVVMSLFEAFYWPKNWKKWYGNHERLLAILSPHLESNICSSIQRERSAENNPFCWYNPSNVGLIFLRWKKCRGEKCLRWKMLLTTCMTNINQAFIFPQ